MNSLKYFLCIIFFSVLVFESGCVIVPGGPYAVGEVEIGFGPPPPPVVVVVTRPPMPSTLHVWIEGRYIVSGGKWAWVKGRWARPEHRGAVWESGRTRRKGNVWLWRPGHWR